jgi:hypothetical protein
MSERLTSRYNLLLTSAERKKLAAIAETQLVSAATVIRIFIHKEHERLFEEAPHRKVRNHQRKSSSAKL